MWFPTIGALALGLHVLNNIVFLDDYGGPCFWNIGKYSSRNRKHLGMVLMSLQRRDNSEDISLHVTSYRKRKPPCDNLGDRCSEPLHRPTPLNSRWPITLNLIYLEKLPASPTPVTGDRTTRNFVEAGIKCEHGLGFGGSGQVPGF